MGKSVPYQQQMDGSTILDQARGVKSYSAERANNNGSAAPSTDPNMETETAVASNNSTNKALMQSTEKTLQSAATNASEQATSSGQSTMLASSSASSTNDASTETVSKGRIEAKQQNTEDITKGAQASDSPRMDATAPENATTPGTASRYLAVQAALTTENVSPNDLLPRPPQPVFVPYYPPPGFMAPYHAPMMHAPYAPCYYPPQPPPHVMPTVGPYSKVLAKPSFPPPVFTPYPYPMNAACFYPPYMAPPATVHTKRSYQKKDVPRKIAEAKPPTDEATADSVTAPEQYESVIPARNGDSAELKQKTPNPKSVVEQPAEWSGALFLLEAAQMQERKPATEDSSSAPGIDASTGTTVPLLVSETHPQCAATPMRRPWTHAEDRLLHNAVCAYGTKSWEFIAVQLRGRTPADCLTRWRLFGMRNPRHRESGAHTKPVAIKAKPTVVKSSGVEGKRAWTPEEDAIIVKFVRDENKRPSQWSKLANLLPGRLGKHCRNRWYNNLAPDIKKGDWTLEEDQTILATIASKGYKWAQMAKLLPGRWV
jgi:Myb-like DNA-binding domain